MATGPAGRVKYLVEQKNWTPVRKLVGWDRYDPRAAQQALKALYAELQLFQNLFQPSMQ